MNIISDKVGFGLYRMREIILKNKVLDKASYRSMGRIFEEVEEPIREELDNVIWPIRRLQGDTSVRYIIAK